MSDKKTAVIIVIIKCPFALTGFLIINREVVWGRERTYTREISLIKVKMVTLQVDDKK